MIAREISNGPGTRGRERRFGISLRGVVAAAMTGLLVFGAVFVTSGQASAATSLCLTGNLQYDYRDAEAGQAKPVVTATARNANWEMWGRTSSAGTLQRLAVGITDVAAGEFKACYDASGPLYGAFVRFSSASTSVWQVIKSKEDRTQYTFDTAITATLSAGRNLGVVKVPASMQRAWSIVDTLNLLYWSRSNPATGCWTRHQPWGQCDMLTFVWSQDAPSAGYWDLWDTKYVFLSGDQPDSRHLVLHEAGHWFQWRLYDRSFPAVTRCNPHYINKSSSTSCAWTEGFADAVAAYVLHDYRFVFPDGQEVSIKNDPDTPDWDQGDAVQGRVGASLLDLWAANGPDGGNWDRTIDLMSREFSQDFREHFLVDRPNAVPPLSTTAAARKIIETHTIYY